MKTTNRSRKYGSLPLILACLCTPGLAADKKPEGFKPPAASQYPNKVSSQGLVMAAKAYTEDDEMKAPFGKTNPYEHGVLPVLLVMENTGRQVLRLQNLRVEYVTSRRQKIENVPPADVPFLKPPEKPKYNPAPIPGIHRKKKNPLRAFEIESRAFSAKMLTPGESAHGFFYFQAVHEPGAMLYVTGIEEAGTGKELFYFEVPLDAAGR